MAANNTNSTQSRSHRRAAHFSCAARLCWRAGAPAAGAFVSLEDGASRWRQVGNAHAENDGSFSVLVHEGLSYILRVWYTVHEDQKRKNAGTTIGPFTASPDAEPLMIVLPPPR
jgi:hypothetical protein